MLVSRLAGQEQKWCVIFFSLLQKNKKVSSPCQLHDLSEVFSVSVLQHKPRTGDSYRADFGLHLSEPEEEFQVLQGLVGSHHQRVELLLHLVVQTCD